MTTVNVGNDNTAVNVYPVQQTVKVFPESTKVTVADNGNSVVISSAAAQGPQGPPGPVKVPSFYESSTPPIAPDQGDQWIVATGMEG